MPETIRTANERLRSRPWRGGFLATFVIANLGITFGMPAHAGVGSILGVVDSIHGAISALGQQEIATLTLTLGFIFFAVLAAVALVRTHKAADRVETVSREQIMELQAEIDRLKTLLLSEPQVLVAWLAATDQADILGGADPLQAGQVRESCRRH